MKITECDWKSGKKYRRKSWDENVYVYFNSKERDLILDEIGLCWNTTPEDIIAEDWIEFITDKNLLLKNLLNEVKLSIASLNHDVRWLAQRLYEVQTCYGTKTTNVSIYDNQKCFIEIFSYIENIENILNNAHD